MVKVRVDPELCQLHGQCFLNAPEVFNFDDNDELRWQEDVDERLRGDVARAAAACPVGAIEIVA